MPLYEGGISSYNPPVSRSKYQRRTLVGALVLTCSLVVTGRAGAQTPVAGFVKVLTGTATLVRGGQSQPLNPGDPVQAADTLRTGPNGHLGITLKDETRLSIGPNSEFTLDTYLFSPGESQLGLVIRVARGILAYISGRIGALAPDTIRIETPASVIGVRGTHVLVNAAGPAPVAPAARATGQTGAVPR